MATSQAGWQLYPQTKKLDTADIYQWLTPGMR